MFAEGVIVPAGNRFAEGRAAANEAMRADPDDVSGRATWSPIRGGVWTNGQQASPSATLTLRKSDAATVRSSPGGLNLAARWLAGLGLPAPSTARW